MRGQETFERGRSSVYCVEAVGQPLSSASFPAAHTVAVDTAPAFPVRTVAQQIESAGGTPLLAIPYYSRNNRGLAPMRVWLDTEPATDAER